MDVREFEYLTVIADTGSVTKAAAKLFMTQSALSKFVQRKEEEMGTPLFERVGKQFVPTYVGKLCIDISRQILALNHQMESTVAQIVGNNRGLVRIAFPTRSTGMFFRYIYPRFLERYRDIDLQIHELPAVEVLEMIDQGQLDLAICAVELKAVSRFQTFPIYPIRLALAVNSEHPLVKRAVVDEEGYYQLDLSDLSETPLILRNVGSRTREHTDWLLSQNNIQPRILLETASSENALHAAETGAGAAFVLDDPAIRVVHPDIRFLYFKDKEVMSNIVVVCNKNKQLTLAERYLLDAFVAQYEQLKCCR